MFLIRFFSTLAFVFLALSVGPIISSAHIASKNNPDAPFHVILQLIVKYEVMAFLLMQLIAIVISICIYKGMSWLFTQKNHAPTNSPER